jgi:phosphoglycolate phosphatase-like HAD superfamily hydrolase
VRFGEAVPDHDSAPGLVVFDVDGTLTDTASVDSECFAAAIVEEFGLRGFDTRWSTYSEFTDSAILNEVFESQRGSGPTADEVARLIERFVDLLKRAHADRPSRFAPIEGAPALVAGLAADGDWRVSVATGGWERSARLKLAYAGIDIGEAPLASAEVSRSRAEIVRTAIDRALAVGGGRAFDRVVLVGDTRWDLRMASELGLPFVGVARGDAARDLAGAGAEAVVRDYRDYEATLEVLRTARPPA